MRQYKDPYKPISIMECHLECLRSLSRYFVRKRQKVFERCSSVYLHELILVGALEGSY